ncbi:MAG: hypothetical protein A2231_01765 [Candidatus Firestonebacteria bacterium RIFOXYA2_FULL_40_8]|nr:MAG: hypothetical protein A2231_01765 [Candidatus Firestonebacteria bacterium RIFOXYA2_FULL_40_8]
MYKILIYIVLLGFISGDGFSQRIEIVISSDAAPFIKIADSYEAAAKKKGFLITGRHNLKEEESQKVVENISLNNPDIILTVGTKAAKMANEKLQGMNVVHTAILNPEEFMSAKSRFISLNLKEDEKFKRILDYFSNFKRCGILYSAKTEKLVIDIKAICEKLGIAVSAVEINDSKEISSVVDNLKGSIDFLYMVADTDIYNSKVIQEFLKNSIKDGIPVVGLSENYTKGGALISFDCDYEDLGLQAAELTEMVFKEKNLIRKDSPRKIVYSLNKHVAEILDVIISPDVLNNAKEVY